MSRHRVVWPAAGLASGAFDGAVVGGLANSPGWFLGGPLWPLGGAVLGVAVAAVLLRRGRMTAVDVRHHAVRFAWARVAVVAAVVDTAVSADLVDLVASVTLAVAVAVGYFIEANAFVDLARRRFPVFSTAVGALAGALTGAVANSGGWFVGGSLWPAGGAAVGALAGIWWGRHPPAAETRARLPERARPAIFLAPALAFIGVALVIPTLRTVYLSFRSRRSEDMVGFENYRALRDDPQVVSVDAFGDIWTGRLVVALLVVLAVALVAVIGRSVLARFGGGPRRWPALVAVSVLLVAPLALGVRALAQAVLAGWLPIGALVVASVAAALLALVDRVAPLARPVPWVRVVRVTASVLGGAVLVSVALAGDALGTSRLFVAGAVGLATLVAATGARAVVVRFGLTWGDRVPVGLLLAGTAVVLAVAVRWLSLQVVSGWLPVGAVTAGAVTVALAAAAEGVTTRRDLDLSGPLPALSVMAAAVLVLLAAVSALRGVLWNNVFWIVFVAGLSTAIGLAIAVLADRSRGESVAKSLIFMPMAISFVGASVIWTFMYDAQPAGESQIGLLNAVWVSYGGDPQLWIQDRPWNTLFLIAIMIWIQTGFAMVILSAAVKGVPEDLREAARIDGASEVQTFWRVTLPHIRSTIIVVVTTLVVTVLKIYDIVQVMTGGRFGTNVVANQMFDEVFQFRDLGRGSALAVLLFVAVLPLMVANVRRLRYQEETR